MNGCVDQFLKHMNLSQQAAAALLEVSQPTVSEWLRGDRPVPHETALQFESLTDGAVLATDARPDPRWRRICDKSWPHHKDGKPILDVQKVAA